jgi:hypothetical protein
VLVVLSRWDIAMMKEIFGRHPDVRAVNFDGRHTAKFFVGDIAYMIRRRDDGSYEEWEVEEAA